MSNSCKRIYAIHHAFQVCCSQSPCWWGRSLLTHATTGDTQTFKNRSGSVSCGVSLLLSLCSGAHKVLFAPSKYLWWAWNFILNVIASSYQLTGASSLPLDVRYVFWWDPTFSCWWCSAAACDFGVFIGEDEHTSFYSAILSQVSEKC